MKHFLIGWFDRYKGFLIGRVTPSEASLPGRAAGSSTFCESPSRYSNDSTDVTQSARGFVLANKSIATGVYLTSVVDEDWSIEFCRVSVSRIMSSPKDRQRYEANIRPDQFSTISHFYMSVMRKERVLPRPRRVKYVLNAYSIIVINNCICILSWYYYKCLIHTCSRNRLFVELLLERWYARPIFSWLSHTHSLTYIECIIVTIFFAIDTFHTHIRLIHVYIYMKVYIYIYHFSLCGRFVSINTITKCLVVCFSGGKMKNVIYKLLCDNWDKGDKDSWWKMNVAHSISHAHILKNFYLFLRS